MIKHLALSTCILLALSASALAAEDASKTQVIYAGAMVDVETGKVLQDRVIVVEDGLISAIGSKATIDEIDLPEDAALIDLSDMTVLPGLSDSHVHLTSDATVHGYKRLTVSTPRAAITGVVNAEKTLMAGFTTVRNLGAPGFADIALMQAIDAGDVPGPHMIPAGRSHRRCAVQGYKDRCAAIFL